MLRDGSKHRGLTPACFSFAARRCAPSRCGYLVDLLGSGRILVGQKRRASNGVHQAEALTVNPSNSGNADSPDIGKTCRARISRPFRFRGIFNSKAPRGWLRFDPQTSTRPIHCMVFPSIAPALSCGGCIFMARFRIYPREAAYQPHRRVIPRQTEWYHGFAASVSVRILSVRKT